MALVVEKDVPLGPLEVGLLGAIGEVSQAQFVVDQVEYYWGLGAFWASALFNIVFNNNTDNIRQSKRASCKMTLLINRLQGLRIEKDR